MSSDGPPKRKPQSRAQGRIAEPEAGPSKSQPVTTQTSSTQSSGGQHSQPHAQSQPHVQLQPGLQEQPEEQRPEPGQSEQPAQGFNTAIAQQCINLVEAYRRGELSRGWVTLSLANKLGIHGKPDDSPAAISALDTYCAQINEIDVSWKATQSGSQHGSRHSSVDPDDEGRERGRSRTRHAGKGKKRADRSQSKSGLSGRSHSRSISPLALSEDEHSSKRQKPDPSEYAWATSNALAEKKLRPEVLQTLVQLRRYAKDIHFAKSNLLNSVGAPEFPDVEWGNVLRGKVVDLDHVFSGQYLFGKDEKHTEKFGPLELSYRTIMPSKTIKSVGDWVIAWQRTTVAVLYAFPHRKLELERYYKHIFSLFGAIHPDYHHRVLDYDRAARKKAAAMHTILLMDIHEFAFLRTLYIESIGASITSPVTPITPDGKKRKGRAPGDEPCRRWNRGICNTSDSACKTGSTSEAVATPRFLRNLVWDDREPPARRLVDFSLTHNPLPDVPPSILNDPTINATLAVRPDLFKIVTPIKSDVFKSLLQDHPNPTFIASVVKGLWFGFWPFADGRPDEYPDTWDETRPPLLDERARQFLREQRDEEISLERYSPSFGPDLLPGMFSMPIHVVPKPHSDKLRLINNLSAGKYSLNGMIRPESIKGAVLDGLPVFGYEFRKLHREYLSEDLIIWKSDVSQAYCRMPMSPHWQIFQIVTIDGQRHVDRCNAFGGWGSLCIWLAFYSCVAWIAVTKRGVSMLVVYVDNNARIQLRRLVQWYLTYGVYMPIDQARLLGLWDDLGLSHNRPKQEHAPRVVLIGFSTPSLTSVPNPMVIAALSLSSKLSQDMSTGPSTFPLLRPALSSLYAKIASKSNRFAPIHVNLAIRTELTWMADHVCALPGIRILSTSTWTPVDLIPHSLADEFAMVDASGTGLGLYFPWQNLGFYAPLPVGIPTNGIFFPESLTICSAIHKLLAWCLAGRHIKRIAILSDNTNAVSIFRSLRAEPLYNPILMSAVDILIANNTEHRVDHIPGEFNVVADALSRDKLS
uniref:N/A n=1 Tax=Ganoderma boninense TaxID=34458 RepID=A0A5K1JW90_9APHY|nr:N/A [Ganoderma boninense]